jgi:NtrC-family two-component system sensor histidine kinase KinB
MRFRSLQTRFLLAGCLIVVITVAGGAWSVFAFASLSAVVGDTLRGSQETIDLTGSLGDMLEREDDALLLALTGKVRNARSDVAQHRQDFDESFARLMSRLSDAEEREAARALREHVDAYRVIGDALLGTADQPAARELYHQKVNPALRKAVADCGHIRELSFRAMQQVGVDAHNESQRSTGIVTGIALVALGLSTLVMVRLAQGILRPVHDLGRSVEAIRRDDFKCRVHVDSEDELGQLAEGFNRMAETLGEYRDSSLGELLLAKATLESTLEALPDAVIVVDPDSTIVSKNPLAKEIVREIGGNATLQVGDLRMPPAVLYDVNETIHHGRPSGARRDLSQALAVSLNGKQLKMLVTVVPIPEFLPGRAGAAIVLTDVTEFVRLDALRSEIVAVASHELKTPLTSLQMNLLLLQEQADSLTPRQREILSVAARGGEELGATIDELLDLTRIDAGQFRLTQERVDVAAVVEQVVSNLRPRYEDAEVAIRVVKEAPSAIVRGDATRLRIVFVNLLTNALKYTPRGGQVTVRLASRQNAEAETQSKLQITVTDTGAGIPPELRTRVFEKFFRVEDQLPEAPKGVRGTGIGLYLSREIIEAHGGTILCTAGEDGRGTQIAIEMNA